MINPLKNLAGKLNHLQITQNRFMRIVELVNAIRPSKSTTFQQATTESILALKSNTQHLNERQYHKFQFDYEVHKESALFSIPSTIFDQLNPHEKKISHLFSTYLAGLNSQQLYYLNLALRKKMNSQFYDWHNLHLNPESPSKGELQVMPTLGSASQIAYLKAQPKKKVMKEVMKMKETL